MPGIGFFAPLPLALMLPFMAAQSMLMGDAFGKSYQYGKRKISAMSNEQFNALTPDDLAKDIQADFAAIIPHVSESMTQSRAFQRQILIEMGEIVKDLPSVLKELVFGSRDITQETSGSTITGVPITNIRLDSGLAQLREGEGGQKQGASLFELDQLKKREKEIAQIIRDAEAKVKKDVTVKPTIPQQTTTLTPSFVNSLTRSDLESGGKRTRATKQGLITWNTMIKVRWNGIAGGSPTLIWWTWKASGWSNPQLIRFITTTQKADKEVNRIKKAVGASYVVSFANFYFIIKD